MNRYELEDVVKIVEMMREKFKYERMHADADVMERWLDDLAHDIREADASLGEIIQDAEDAERDAKHYQDVWLEALQDAESHIRWLEDEFADEIEQCDRYERSC